MIGLRNGVLAAVTAFLSACGGGGGGGGSGSVADFLAALIGPDTSAPTIVSTSPANLEPFIALSATVSATASEAVDPATLNTATFTLIPSAGGAAVPGQISVSGNTATFTPFFALAASTQYTATITTALTDTSGNALANTFSWRFTTVTVPGAPTIGTATATVGGSQADVTFTPPASNGGAAITSFTATSNPSGITATGAASPIMVPGLVNGTPYTFTVVATNAVGNGPPSGPSNSVTPNVGASVPGQPTAVTATAGNGQASVAFAGPASSGVPGPVLSFTVTALIGGVPTGISASGGGTPIVVPGLANGTAYTFTAVAFNSTGPGPASAPSNAVTPAGLPGAPTAAAATASDTQATVTFSAPASNGGSAIISYTVTSSPGGIAATGGGTTIVVPGLTNGTAYTFTVRATNSVGTGTASLPSAPVTPATVPGAPVGASATAGNTQATVAFSAPASNGGSAITGFTVTSNPAGGVDTNAGTTSLSHAVTGLLNGVAYTFTVTAANGVGTGVPSAPSAVVTPTAGAVPGAPTGATATAGNAQATVVFSAPASSGGSAISGYTVSSNPPGGVDTNAGTTGLSHLVTGLTNGTTYTFTVTATNLGGNGPPSAASNAVIPATTPGAPTAVSAIAGAAQATVSFTPPASNGGAAIVIFTATSSPSGITAFGGASPITYPAGSLANGTAYTFTVTATNSVGTGPASAPSSSVTPNPAITVPSAPTSAFATAGNTQATVTFAAPASNGGSAITGYTVTSNPSGITASLAGAAAAPVVVPGLTNGTAYTFTVTATNSVGVGPPSGASNTVTPATTPGAPTAVTATAGNAQATVNFGPPASNGGAAITRFDVNICSPGCVAGPFGAAAPIVVPGLINGTTYTFTVTATNGIGAGSASPASNPVIPNPTATVPGPPTGASAVAGNAQATVTFTTPASNGGSAITGYTVTSNPNGITASLAGAVPAPVVVPGLTNGTAYTFTVTATNSVGTGPSSGASNSVTPATLPGAPTAASAIAGNAQATVSFTPPASNGGAAITRFDVNICSPGCVAGPFGAASPIVVPGLINGTPYTFAVTATNGIGTGAASAPSSAVTPTSATVPGAPTAASATAGNAQATVTFTAGATGGSAITGFTVTSNPGGGVDANAGNLTVPRNITGLTNGVAYTFTVTATNAVGISVPSAASNGVTPSTTPGAPTAVSATSGNGQATVSFTPASNGGSPITGFRVFCQSGAPCPASVDGASSPIVVTGLTNGNPYTFTVRAINVNGLGTLSAASNSVTPASTPPACSATIPVPSTPSGSISLRAVAARTTGVSPVAVFFDASATTGGTASPFHDLEYRWDFGDPGSGNWGDNPVTGSSGTGSNTSRNAAYGPVAAHVYEPAAGAFSGGIATRTAVVTAYDGTDTASCSIQITVQDPAVLFAANTVCVGGQTMPAAGAGGCPVGAAVALQPNLSLLINTQVNTTGRRRVLLAAGETFVTLTPGSAVLSLNGPGILGSFGAANNGKAILRTSSSGTLSDILRLNGGAVTHGSDWRLMDLEFDGQNNGSAQAIFGVGRFDQLTMLRLFIHNIGGGIEIPMQSATPPLHDQLALADSTIQRLLSSGGAAGSATHGILSGSSQTAILGNLFDDSTTAFAEHMIRIQYMDRGVIGHNRISRIAVGKEMLALRAPCSAACPLPGASNNHFPTLVADGAAAATRKVVISDNRFDTNTFVGVKIGPVNNNDPVRFNNIILERNFYKNVAGGGAGITAQADQLTIRNEIIDISVSTVVQQGIGLDNSALGMPPASNVRVFNNTIFSTAVSNGTFQGVGLAPGTAFIDIRNNLARAPNAIGPLMVRDFGSAGPVTNTNNSTNAQINALVLPSFVNPNPSVPTDYALTGAAVVYLNVGVALPVFSDFFRVARPAGAGFDIGATEQ